MRDVNQETGELQSDAPAVQSSRHQGQNSYPGQQQQQQQQYHQGRPQPPAGYSGSKTNTIPLGKKRDFSAVSTEPQNLGRANPGTTATYESQQPPQPSIGANGNAAASNAAPPPPQGLFKSAPAPFKSAPAPFKSAPAPFKSAPAPFKSAPAPPAGLFKSAAPPPTGLFKSAAPPPTGLFKSAAPPPFKKAKQ